VNLLRHAFLMGLEGLGFDARQRYAPMSPYLRGKYNCFKRKSPRRTGAGFAVIIKFVVQSISCTTVRVPGSTSITRSLE
jgi:hypothetical protein